MIELRVTKYDPSLRDQNGHFTGNEWTDASDIGKSFGGKVLTLENYLAVENQYISVIQQFMRIAGIKQLHISDLERHSCSIVLLPFQEECKRTIKSVRDKQTVCYADIPAIVRLILRNAIWCRLHGENGFYVHFGWDYYMYIGYEGDANYKNKISTDLFIEQYPSPHRVENNSGNR